LVSVWFVIDIPLLHFVWIIGTFSLTLYAVTVVVTGGVELVFVRLRPEVGVVSAIAERLAAVEFVHSLGRGPRD